MESLTRITINIHAELQWIPSDVSPCEDTHRICEIHTKTPIEENILLLLVDNGSKLPYTEWIKYTGSYPNGYYTIIKTDYGYKYDGVTPYYPEMMY